MKVMKLLKKAYCTIKNNPKSLLSFQNFIKFYKRLFSKTKNESFYDPYDSFEYNEWLKKQKDLIEKVKLKYSPKISIIIPIYNVKAKFLDKCIESVLNQSYTNWELCLINDASTNNETNECLNKYLNIDSRIIIKNRKKNGNISVATNDGIEMSSGEYIAFLDNDDELDPNALLHVAKELNDNKKIELIYTDEDKIDENGKRFDPFFKPDWSPDTFLSYNYICHFVVVKKSLIDKIGKLRTEYDGCQDYDFLLRATEKTQNIYHIPKILYHWRAIDSSTAKDLNNKKEISIKSKKLLQETLERRKINATVNITNENNYYIKYKLEKNYKVSIIIPTKDHIELLTRCIDSIINKTDYKNYEIIIVNNNSSEKETFEKLNEYKKNKKIKIIDMNCEFNYSFLNNEAVKSSTGEYLVLLNNDTEIISENWLTEMLSYASQSHIGTVGVKLLYDDNTIQHGGIILGLGGVAGHAFINENRNYSGPYSTLQVVRNVGGNTAACLMINKEKYTSVKGLDEKIKVAFNDVDFNLKMLDKGYYNVFLPNIEIYHYESKSRGLEDTKEKIERFNSEVIYMQKKWNNKLKTDPYYNNNYSYKYNYKIDIE